MNIIAVDDERPALRILERAILEAVPDAAVASFSTAAAALEYAKETKIDIAFLDIHMSGMRGLELGKALNVINTKTNLIFVTGYAEHALEALSIGTSGYIIKPPEPEAILVELDRLRYPIETNPNQRVRIKCFGGFGIFIDGEPLLISWSKPKELLAYLVHREGAGVSTAEIAAVLWEDKEYSHSIRTQTQRVISQLLKRLKGAGIGYIVQRSRNSMAVDIKKFSCDYYDYLKSGHDCIMLKADEYMTEYSWGEFTAGYLSNKK